MDKKAIVLFDLDGTLIDSTQAIYESFCETFEAFGKEAPSDAAVRGEIGHTLEDMFASLGVEHAYLSVYVAKYREIYRTKMERGTQLLPSAREAIKEASEFATLGVVTTKRGDYSQILLHSLGVGAYFSVVVGIEMVSKPKPDKEPILNALEALNAQGVDTKALREEGRIYMIGDTILDLKAACAAGVLGVGVLCGFGKKADLEAYLQSMDSVANTSTHTPSATCTFPTTSTTLVTSATLATSATLYDNALAAVEAIKRGLCIS